MSARHKCVMFGWPRSGYGEAVDGCDETRDGEFWVGNGEYSSQVNYCPACGAKAPKQVATQSAKTGGS